MTMFMIDWCNEDLHQLCRGFMELMQYYGAVYRCSCLCHEEKLV